MRLGEALALTSLWMEEVFARVSDNGSNMLKGWKEGFQIPCCDHTLELSVNLYTSHDFLASTFEKGRGQVGYFNMSNIGYTEERVGLHASANGQLVCLTTD